MGSGEMDDLMNPPEPKERRMNVTITYDGRFTSNDPSYNRKGDYNHMKDNILRIHGVKSVQVREFD